MKKRLFNLMALLSVLILPVAAVLWIWSYYTAFYWGYYAPQDRTGVYHDYYLGSDCGRFFYTWFWQNVPSNPVRGRFHGYSTGPDPGRWFWSWSRAGDQLSLLGFTIEHANAAPARAWYTLAIPYWFIMAICCVVLVSWSRKRGERIPGRCPACGYDLRATPERCPECGFTVADGGRV